MSSTRPSRWVADSAVPDAVQAVLRRLRAAGFEAYLVGGCVRDLLRGAPVADFDVATSAPPERVLELFPRAVPIGLRHGTVMVPTSAGPADVTTFRGGDRLEDDLSRRDFTVNALAWDPAQRRLVDPFGGFADLEAGRLRAVGSAEARLREDPLRALRASRLVATLELEPEPETEAALASVREALRSVARERIRRELEALLMAPKAGSGLALLRRSGLEAVLARGVAADADRIVAALPAELVLRLAAWLRGTDALGILSRFRFPRSLAQEVSHLVRLHPIDRGVRPDSDVEVRRLLRRAGEEHVEALLTLREAEARASGRRGDAVLPRLAALRAAIERVRRSGAVALRRRDLALDGRAVMDTLGCRPGPRVGAALRYLTDRVVEEPNRNTPEGLRALLEEWKGA